MKKVISISVYLVLIILFVSSCSVIKDQTASTNFKRVKYNSNLKLTKSRARVAEVSKVDTKLPKTVKSFEQEEMQAKENNVYAQVETIPKKVVPYNNDNQTTIREKSVKTNNILKSISAIQIKDSKAKKLSRIALKRDNWWEDDIEDWPWLQIVLAVIAILIIAILISLLVGILGGLISSLLGLILLIALAYILYTLWF